MSPLPEEVIQRLDAKSVSLDEDEQIINERKIVDNLVKGEPLSTLEEARQPQPKYVAIGSRLFKRYKNNENYALSNISIALRKGEILGLLGPSGSGKTTVMKMFTGQMGATHGQVLINDEKLSQKSYQYVGYCPQVDPLWDTLTIREHLESFALLTGVRQSAIKALTRKILTGLRIAHHQNKYVQECSLGVRRKLSFAIAMLGHPTAVFLDEPSSGMDPQSKRLLWDTITETFHLEKGAVLSTHLMPEAEALCNRISILVNGEMKCLGTVHEVKEKYGKGYILDIKIRKTDQNQEIDRHWKQLDQELQKIFPSKTKIEKFTFKHTYSIEERDVPSPAEAFKALDTIRKQSKFSIEEYNFGKTTLEQIFLLFVKSERYKHNTYGEDILKDKRSISATGPSRKTSFKKASKQ